ncbi:MAG: hypothetical protein ABIJ41_03495 [Candidatus Omnitrophota bacterium]
MKSVLARCDRNILRRLREIGWEAEKNKMNAYVVGGFVRDLLLHKNNFDVDVVVEGDAVKLAQLLAQRKKAKVTIYPVFKTATLMDAQGGQLDLSSARKEHYAYSGALPAVTLGSIHDDLFRRDFAINAMAISIHPDQFGMVIDDFRGQKDLDEKSIRVLHDQSFKDDPTRILRAVRFEQRLHFKIERHTLDLMKKALSKHADDDVKPPRYFEEFKKILKEDQPVRCLERLHQFKGLEFLGDNYRMTPSIKKSLKNIEKNRKALKKRFALKQFDLQILYLMALWHKRSGKSTEKTMSRFHFTREDKKRILESRNVISLSRRLSVKRMRPSDVYRILKPLSYETVAFLTTQTKNPRIQKRIFGFLKQDQSVALSVNGEDLKRLGIKEGRMIGDILKKCFDAKLDGKVRSKKQEMRYAQKWIQRDKD